MGGTVSWHYDGPVDCELLGREDVEAADNLRIDKDGTVLLRKIGDDVGAICREPGFG